MRRKKNGTEWILLLLCVFLLLLLAIAKRKLDEKEEQRASSPKEHVTMQEKAESAEKVVQEYKTEKVEQEAMQAGGNEKKWEAVTRKIRVLLTDTNFSEYEHSEVILQGNSDLLLNGERIRIAKGEPFGVTKDSAYWKEGKLHVEAEDPASGIFILSIERNGSAPCYEGSMDLYLTEHGILLVNELDLETYLRYVVPSEMPSNYEKEALKAQAVCARTYAVRHMRDQTLQTYHADVDDSVSYQVYHTMLPSERSDEAVAETKGMILTWKGEPITAYFFSTSCGRTSTDEVWNHTQKEEYLKSVAVGKEEGMPKTEEAFATWITQKKEQDLEAEDGWYRWNVALPAEELNQRFDKEKLGSIQNITVLERSEGGVAERVKMEGTKGTLELFGEYEIRKKLNARGFPIQKNDGTQTKQMNLLPSACFTVVSSERNGEIREFVFYGGGYGHGVGMSQNGAEHLAERGKNFQEILQYFFADISLACI